MNWKIAAIFVIMWLPANAQDIAHHMPAVMLQSECDKKGEGCYPYLLGFDDGIRMGGGWPPMACSSYPVSIETIRLTFLKFMSTLNPNDESTKNLQASTALGLAMAVDFPCKK